MDYHKKVKLIPFIKDRECRLYHCEFNEKDNLQCLNESVEILTYTLDYMGKNLKSNNSKELRLEDGLSFNCPCYELDENYCPVCKSKLTYNQSKCNYICHICGHGMEEY